MAGDEIYEKEEKGYVRLPFSRSLQVGSSWSTSPVFPAADSKTSDASFSPMPLPTSSDTIPMMLLPVYMCNTVPKNCGCPDLALANYNNMINITKSGMACVMWEDKALNNWWKIIHGDSLLQKYPDASHKGNNFCCNPTGWWHGGAMCFTGSV